MLNVTFWGSRGSVPVSGPEFARHGGSTTCLEITLDSPRGETPERLIIDCGTGLTELGKKWGRRPKRAIFLQTHFHWDHIQGFPFFKPLFDPGSKFEMWSATHDDHDLRAVLASHMTRPTFPVGLDIFPAQLDFQTLPGVGVRRRGDLVVRWAEVCHPSGCTAYRLDYRGASVVFSGDLEVQAGGRDTIVELAQGADLLIMDAQYTAEDYASRAGFGHSTTLDAVSVASEAGVANLVLTHHDPSHADDDLDAKLAEARAHAPASMTVANARERLSVTIGAPTMRQRNPTRVAQTLPG